MKKRYDKITTYFKENLVIVIPMCITALIFNALMCLIPIIEGEAINSLKYNDKNKVLICTLVFIGLVLFVQINRFFKRYLVRVFGNKMSLKMRSISLKNLLKKDMDYFINNNAGDILNRNLNDIYETTEGIRKMTTECFDTFVLLIGYLITLLIMDYQIALISLIFIIISIIVSHFMKKIVYKTNKEYRKYLSINKNITIICLNNELYYRGFGVSDNYYNKYMESTNTLKKKNTKALLFKSSLEPLYSAIALMGVFFIIFMGGKKVIDGVYEIGVLSAFLTTYLLVAKKASKIGKLFNAYQGFKVSWERCKGYLIEEDVKEFNENIKEYKLVLKDFSYSYDDFKLPNINIEVNSGEMIGICGRVHSGKTTLLRALTGIYGYEGSALFDSFELKEIKDSKIQYVGYCSANVSIFSDTVINNIKLDRTGNIDKAIKTSRLDLDELGGIEANLSHSNSNISGGQQKRLQMARCLYNEAPIVLLDDPFQSVSKDMACEMVEYLNDYKIVFLSSNNSDILKKCDKVIFLNEELLIDTYDNLLKNNDFKKMMEV